jgi:uncharacterized protein (DUF58 family)
VLTRPGALSVLGSVAALAAGRAFGVAELFVLGATGLVLVAAAVAWVRRPAPTVVLERRVHPPRPAAGSTARVEVDVANRGGRATPVLEVVDAVEGTTGARLVVGPIPPQQRHLLGYRLPTARRGRLAIGPLHAQLVDPFGLARRRLPGPGVVHVTVLPAVAPLPLGPVGGGDQEPMAGLSTSAMATTGIEDLATLRPYVVGDDLRRVHWPSSAHADDLLVRRDEERWQGHLTVVLDQRPSSMSPDGFEEAVSAAASLVHAAAEAGDRIRLVRTDGSDSAMVDAHRGEPALLEDLALVGQVEAAAAPSVTAAGDADRRSALVVLTGTDALPLAGIERFEPVVIVRFGAVAGARPAEIAVAPGERFAPAWAAWHRGRRPDGVGAPR